MEIPTTALIGILAAFVTGLFSFINLVIGKDQKTSEFRQQWIDALRNDISELVSLAINLKDAAQLYKNELDNSNHTLKFSEIHKTIKDDIHKFGITLNRIKLRLNKKKDINTLNRLTEFYKMANSSEISADHLNLKAEELISEFQGILKNEWERVKKGEPAYFVTKYVVCFAIVLMVGLLVSAKFGWFGMTSSTFICLK